MTQENKTVKWYEVFKELVRALATHYIRHKDNSESNPGRALYDILIANSNFIEHHKWIKNFADGQFGVPSVDPFHIFASFNHGRMPAENRTTRLRDLFEALEIPFKYNEIDFSGCPAPQTIRIISVRRQNTQDEIWDFFYKIYRDGKMSLMPHDFENLKYWYGIEFSSFTIFLFWIKSWEFLPVDKNTRTFLVSTRLLEYAPKDYSTYKEALDKLDYYNKQYVNEKYGENGLYREITHISYLAINLGQREYNMSKTLFSLIDENSLYQDRNAEIQQPIDTQISDESIPASGNEEIIKDELLLGHLGFKLIALKVMDDCDLKMLNVLKRGQLYQFENVISVGDEIIYNPDTYSAVYDWSNTNNKDIAINVTAVVGKNGSGKSSLIELLFRIINNIAFNFIEILNTNNLKPVDGIHTELYYIVNGKFISLEIKDTIISIQDYNLTGNIFKPTGNTRKFELVDFENLFYTIAVNYSVYSLNSLHDKDWVRLLFHKNDRYQCPIVINPMRTKGNIDINIENDLVKYRLLTNLFVPISEPMSKDDIPDIGIRQITKNQEAFEVIFELIPDKNKFLFTKENENGEEERIPYERVLPIENKIFSLICRVFEIDASTLPNNDIINEARKYIVRKFVKITQQYSDYSDYFDNVKIDFKSDDDLDSYMSNIASERSHITYKLRQAINFLKYNNLYPKDERKFTKEINSHSIELQKFISFYSASLKSDSTDKTKNSSEDGLDELDRIELIPPPIFKPTIRLRDDIGTISDFEDLSSGEKQRIHTISSILYHIRNLSSIDSKNGLINYPNINLLLDEIELYYHPDMQREYLWYLLKMIRTLEVDTIKAINICFVTHSPFILSDISNTNILFLKENGRPNLEASLGKTFGANIHDLLKHSFFLDNGTIGEYAKQTIIELSKFLKSPESNHDHWNKENTRKTIDLIAEPIIKQQLDILYDKKYYSNDKNLIEQRIAMLQRELNSLT